MWYPNSVEVGWAPYSDGYWSYVGPWGWTWVDYEPWGYAPFHYGRWAYIGNRWGWFAKALTLPVRLARELRSFRPQAILTQSPYEAAAVLVGRRLARSDARLVVDVHGDWRTLSRLYGSRLRALLRPLTDRIAVAAL